MAQTEDAALVCLVQEARGFIFDLDGTLYDSRGMALRLLREYPWDLFLIGAERKTRKSLAGDDYGSPQAYCREFFSRMSGMTGKAPRWLHGWYRDRYMPRMCRVLRKGYRPRPRTGALLARLGHRAFPFAVYSDYPQGAARLAALGIDPGPWAAAIYGPEHFGAQKPAPRPFAAIAQDLGVPPAHMLVLGDRDDTDGAGAAAYSQFLRAVLY
ncbi:MAG: HAD family hydrolase [Treponema sp.]|nr:HAD family hydrolase [Treponema sp.]